VFEVRSPHQCEPCPVCSLRASEHLDVIQRHVYGWHDEAQSALLEVLDEVTVRFVGIGLAEGFEGPEHGSDQSLQVEQLVLQSASEED